MTLAEFCPMIYFGGFGITVVDTCFIQTGSVSYWFALIPIFVNIPFNFLCFVVLRCSRGYNRNKPLQKMVRACFSMCVCWGFPIFTASMKTLTGNTYQHMNNVAFVVGCSAGTVIAVSRLGSVAVFKRLYTKTIRPRQNTYFQTQSSTGIESLLMQDCCVNQFFAKIADETIKDIVVCLSMILLNPDKSEEEEYSYGYGKRKYNFKDSDFQVLNQFVSLSRMNLKCNGIWEYGKEYFDRIKEVCGIKDKDLLNSFCAMTVFSSFKSQNTGGRSGAFLMMTPDERFVIKVINRNERYLMLDILPSYAQRICNFTESKIVRIFGLFKIRSTKHCFIIMENLVPCRKNALIFDLKGSIEDRFVETNEDPYGQVLKDENFLKMQIKLKVLGDKKNEVIKAINDDLKFFSKNNIIDYSLVLAIYKPEIKVESRYRVDGTDETLYSLGIIDFLQCYSFEKKIELFYKRIQGKRNVSVCSASTYSSRFSSFIELEFFESERV